MAGELDKIKEKIRQASILSSDEKEEWLFLLPRMTEEQIKELDRILSIKMPSLGISAQQPKTANSDLRFAIRKEPPQPSQSPIANRQLPDEGLYRSTIAELARKRQPPKEIYLPPLPETSLVPQISSLSIVDLRQALSVHAFLEEVAEKMRSLLTTRQATAAQIMIAFEQSPLYRGYLETGLKILSPHPSSPTRGEEMKEGGGLSLQEFEAIADFRASLKRILSIV